MPAGKKYRSKKPMKKQSNYKKKINAYKRPQYKKARNMMRPFVETKFREVPRATGHHLIYNNVTGVSSVAPNSQMSINALNLGTGANNAVPKNFTCIVPQAWSDAWAQGVQRDQVQGRAITPTYLNCKVEIDFAGTVPNETVTGLGEHWMCLKGWAKNSLIKQVQDERSLPGTSAEIAIAMGQIVAKCCQQSGITGDRLDFPTKKKDIVIQGHFPVRANLNNRYLADVSDTSLTGAPPSHGTAFALPKVYNFSWTIKRKQLLRHQLGAAAGTNAFMLADAWVPFVAFYNRELNSAVHTHTPDLANSSKLYFTDQ